MFTAIGIVECGHFGADLIMAVPGLVIMSLTGLVVGWRIHHGIGHALVACGLLLLVIFVPLAVHRYQVAGR